jgi:hypothetical protein
MVCGQHHAVVNLYPREENPWFALNFVVNAILICTVGPIFATVTYALQANFILWIISDSDEDTWTYTEFCLCLPHDNILDDHDHVDWVRLRLWLRPPMGLLFIPQIINEHGETWWNDIDRKKLLIRPPELSANYTNNFSCRPCGLPFPNIFSSLMCSSECSVDGFNSLVCEQRTHFSSYLEWNGTAKWCVY